jgi:hypothetical protein
MVLLSGLNESFPIAQEERRQTAIQTLAATAAALHAIGGGCFASEPELQLVLAVLQGAGVRRVKTLRDIAPTAVELATGNEHAVWFYQADGESRVLRTVHEPGLHFGHSLRLDDYLTRFEIGNVLFGDDVRLEGVDDRGFVYTSQRFVEGDRPDFSQIYLGMSRMGWQCRRHNAAEYQSPDGRLILSDLHTKNAVVSSWNGLLYPIDCVFLTAEQLSFCNNREDFMEAYERPPASLTALWRNLSSPHELGFSNAQSEA